MVYYYSNRDGNLFPQNLNDYKMIIGLCLSRSDHSALDRNLLKIKIFKKKKKNRRKFFFGFFFASPDVVWNFNPG